MKKNKGFTLIELLAVMIVLVIIILIAYNIIKKNVDDAIDNTTRANAAIYIKAANALVSEKSVVDDTYEAGHFTVADLETMGIKISGTKPDSGYVTVANSEITYSCLEYDGYRVEYEDGKVGNPIKGICDEVDTD